MSYLLSPSLRTILSLLVQASPWSTLVKYTHPDKREKFVAVHWTLCFQGGVDVATAHSGKGHPGPYSKST